MDNSEQKNAINSIANQLTPRQRFVAEMEQLLVNLKKIDKDTPWQHVEPEWWLAMTDIERKAIDAIKKFKVQN